MKYLLDTHTFLWFISGHRKLSSLARETIESLDNQRMLSIASIWEISIKASLQKLEIKLPLKNFLDDQLKSNSIGILELNFNHVTYVAELPFYHRDPFDRVIISQSIVEKLPIISCDVILDKYSIMRIW